MRIRVEGMARTGLHNTDVSVFLKVEDFTVYDNVFWGFPVRGFDIIGQICPAESKDLQRREKSLSMCACVCVCMYLHLCAGDVKVSS